MAESHDGHRVWLRSGEQVHITIDGKETLWNVHVMCVLPTCNTHRIYASYSDGKDAVAGAAALAQEIPNMELNQIFAGLSSRQKRRVALRTELREKRQDPAAAKIPRELAVLNKITDDDYMDIKEWLDILLPFEQPADANVAMGSLKKTDEGASFIGTYTLTMTRVPAGWEKYKGKVYASEEKDVLFPVDEQRMHALGFRWSFVNMEEVVHRQRKRFHQMKDFSRE